MAASLKQAKTFLDNVVEQFGEFLLSEDRVYKAIPTGCLSLDASIGIGGIPKGRITEIYGPEGSGKTTIALSLARSAVHGGDKVLYIDVENLLDYHIIPDMLGEALPKDRFYLVQPDTAEQAFEIAEMGINSKEFGLIVFDSVGALAPEKEKDDKFTDSNVALVPRLVSKFLRRNAYGIRDNDIAFLFLNQVRDTIGSYVPTLSTPGGRALKHFTALRIALSKGQEIKVKDDKVENTIGINTKFVVKKNKLSSPFRSFTIPIIFGKGLDYYRDFVTFAEMLGVLHKAGPYYKLGDEIVGKGFVATVENLKSSPSTLAKIEEMVYNVVNKVAPKITSFEEESIDE